MRVFGTIVDIPVITGNWVSYLASFLLIFQQLAESLLDHRYIWYIPEGLGLESVDEDMLALCTGCIVYRVLAEFRYLFTFQFGPNKGLFAE